MRTVDVFCSPLFCGGIAGVVVDIVLFPLDTIKTRMQSRLGFKESGGFKGIYSGIITQVILSAPVAAVFFVVYQPIIYYAFPHVSSQMLLLVSMLAASLAEVVSCLVKVPKEIIKQRSQVLPDQTTFQVFKVTVETEGVKALFQGFISTILRQVPYSLINLPLWELLKGLVQVHIEDGSVLDSWEVALCGAIAGAVAAGITIPMDVIKTRIMIAEVEDENFNEDSVKILNTAKALYAEMGIRGFFAGIVPRVIWMFLAGFVFYGTYDLANHFYLNYIGVDTKDNSTSLHLV